MYTFSLAHLVSTRKRFLRLRHKETLLQREI